MVSPSPSKDSPEAQVKIKSAGYRWAEKVESRLNTGLGSLTPMVVAIALTAGFNNSQSGRAFYEWLNTNYTPFQINAWWSWGVTALVYWVGGLAYMVVDLLQPRWAAKYKIQPSQSVGWKEYKKILWIVARNQVCCFALVEQRADRCRWSLHFR